MIAGGAAVLIIGVIAVVLVLNSGSSEDEPEAARPARDTEKERRAAAAPERVPPPVPAERESTPPPSAVSAGYLAVGALPWGRIAQVVDVDSSKPVAGVKDLETPHLLELPPGRYRVTISHKDFGTQQSPVVTVAAGATASVQVRFSKFDVDRMLEEF